PFLHAMPVEKYVWPNPYSRFISGNIGPGLTLSQSIFSTRFSAIACSRSLEPRSQRDATTCRDSTIARSLPKLDGTRGSIWMPVRAVNGFQKMSRLASMLAPPDCPKTNFFAGSAEPSATAAATSRVGARNRHQAFRILGSSLQVVVGTGRAAGRDRGVGSGAPG